ncbi:MAG: RagB/SusD family nutrient uptake outer membrane protein, partial [Pyrinomonadaceae bacterium]|nr:RagB/SusD family nutrient uptake outer membrane protein [Sphingobacteriaceae bacterium]
MINYKYKLIVLVSALTFFSSSCEKSLKIDPENSVDAQKALITSGDVKGALVGAYTNSGLAGLYGGRLLVSTDLLGYGDDLAFYGTYQGYTELANKSIIVNNGFVEEAWNAAYGTINVCNTVLENVSKVEVANIKRVEGEAKFLRGMIYFDLARSFGKAWNDTDGSPATNLAVPLILSSIKTDVIGPEENKKRNTVAEIYAQAIQDLKDAKVNLPASNGFFANKYAASAVLARIYLTQNDYANAEAEADVVINAGFSLLTDYSQEWPSPDPASRVSNTSEDIFAIQVSNQAGVNSLNEVFATSTYGGRGDIEVQDAHFGLYESGDLRADFFYDDVFTGKHQNQYGNIKLIRLAEMYLIRSEARALKAGPNL